MTATRGGPARLPVWRAAVWATALVCGTVVIGADADADEAPTVTSVAQMEPDQALPAAEAEPGRVSPGADNTDEPAGADVTPTAADTAVPEDPAALRDETAPIGAAAGAQVDLEQATQGTEPPDGSTPEQQAPPPEGHSPPVTQPETEEPVEAGTPTDIQFTSEEPTVDSAERHEPGDDSTHDDSTHDDSTHDDSTHDDSTHDDSTHDDHGGDDSTHDDHGGGKAGFTFTVNGQPSKGGTSPHLEGCSLTVVTVGPDDGEAHEVTVSVVPAGGHSGTYASGTPALGDGGYAITFDMAEHLSEVEIHKNGYHLAVVVDIDGSQSKSRPLWLACGASGRGHPTLLTFEVNWVPVADQALPADLSEFELHASTDKGSARCTYPEAGGPLVCVYTNHGGHGGTSDALVMPGGKKHEFRVGVENVPEGWEVNEATVGAFVGRSICGHHEDPGGTPCGYTVEVRGVAVTETATTTTTAPSTTTTDPSTTTTTAPESSSTSETTVDAEVAGPTTGPATTGADALDTSLADQGSLPVTGAATPFVLFIALGLLGCGMSLLALSTRASRP